VRQLSLVLQSIRRKSPSPVGFRRPPLNELCPHSSTTPGNGARKTPPHFSSIYPPLRFFQFHVTSTRRPSRCLPSHFFLVDLAIRLSIAFPPSQYEFALSRFCPLRSFFLAWGEVLSLRMPASVPPGVSSSSLPPTAVGFFCLASKATWTTLPDFPHTSLSRFDAP